MKACTKSCRFPGRTVERIEDAASENEVLESELFRRAVRYYIRENPDELAAFSGDEGPNVERVEPDELVAENLDEPPVEETADETAEATNDGEEEADANEEESDGNALLGGVYDPCEEGA